MILDNSTSTKKVINWIAKETPQEVLFNIVTGYLTVGALADFIKVTEGKLKNVNIILGDFLQNDPEENPLDLLSGDISIEKAFHISQQAEKVINFLKQDSVQVKMLEPNFCHAKLYLAISDTSQTQGYFVTGSSNLTEAGLGIKTYHNVELNIAGQPTDPQHNELKEWFNTLWDDGKAKSQTKDADGKHVNVKKYLIDLIQAIYKTYTPEEIYFKILFELFAAQVLEKEFDPDFKRQVERLENSVIYNTLYEFQKKGALSLIRMLQKYNGAILADAVGLGKTWTALAVMKYYQQQGREIILLCPKKLESNWRMYLKYQDSRFEADQFDYFIRFHTDMDGERMDKYDDRADKLFNNDKPKLIVIDESHNLRNEKSKRYKFLLENVIQPNEDIKVLLLSATPINNRLTDIRNQFGLMVKGKNHGYYETLGIRNLASTFKDAEEAFNNWRASESTTISDFIKSLPPNFFTLTDALTVARTRDMVLGLDFPNRDADPINIFVTPKKIGDYDSFDDLFDSFPPMLSGYQPSYYVHEDEEVLSILQDEKQRDFFLAKMMYILMVKRLESSWFSFFSTVEKIRDHHQNALNKIRYYQKFKDNIEIDEIVGEEYDDEELEEFLDLDLSEEELTLGKKRKVNLSDIDEAGNLELYKNDLKEDLLALNSLLNNLEKFEKEINNEITTPNNEKSVDSKLEKLIKEINKKRERGANNNNQKVIIFTVYRDTAIYLFNQLKARGFSKLAMVSGTGSLTSNSEQETKKFEGILERFAPYTKLYREKEWEFSSNKEGMEGYNEWVEWVAENDEKTHEKLQEPIDILIATDTLSEGQNLQDADMVINYDIHWNPVRIIQRMGRIDRLGSPNSEIFGVNFWPSDNINNYLDLQGRIEARMAAMTLAGSEVDLRFTETFKQIAENKDLENKQKERMLKQMETTWEDIEVSDQSLGFDHLTLEKFRQDLLEDFKKDKTKYEKMPKAIYSGFKGDKKVCPKQGILALLGYPAKTSKSTEHKYLDHKLIYIDYDGNPVFMDIKDILDALSIQKDNPRFVPDAVDKGNPEAIKPLVNALKQYLENQLLNNNEEDSENDSKNLGEEPLKVIEGLKKGDKKSTQRIRQNIKVEEQYQLENLDLITWLLITI